MPTPQTKPVIFISYAHLDEPEKPREGEVQWLSFVHSFLRVAVKYAPVEIWVDQLMRGGEGWDPEIERKLRKCDIFILLVSHNSLSSDYIVDKEITIIEQRQKRGEFVHFYPLLLTPTPRIALRRIGDKNLRPRDAKPLSDHSTTDRYRHMSDATDEIAAIAEEIAARKSAPVLSTAPPPQPIVLSSLPPNPRMIGRADRLEELVEAILDHNQPLLVSGALGMGKTTLALAAAYDPRVIARFGMGRRFFVNLEPVPDADGLLRRFAADLGLVVSGSTPEVVAEVAAVCAAAPTLAILDNLETPWRKDTAATEALLGRLAVIAGLRLIITVRGEPPNIPAPGAVALGDVEQLGDADARALFLRRAGDQFAADPALPDLLRALDGHPLSIELLAGNAAGRSNLKGLAADWTDRRADLLRHGAADNRKTSLSASLRLSLDALRPSSAAHRLIRLMALLPDGMSEADSRTTLSDSAPTREERGAALRLESARLASRPDGRWRLLAPVRETLFADFPPEAQDRTRLVKLFLARAALGSNAGTSRWGKVSEGLIAEAGNLDAMIGVAVTEAELPDGVSPAIRGIADFHCFTGLASVMSLPAAAKRFQDAGDPLAEARCLQSLGDVALDRSDHEGTRQRYETARSDHEGARQRYETALLLYREVGDVLGEADCVKGLGDVALRRSDHEGARKRYEAALPLYQKVSGVLGEATCIEALGDIAFERRDYEEARERYNAALPLYKQVENAAGEANCIGTLGDIAFKRRDYEEARGRFEAALALYIQAGDVLGQAFCIEGLGDIAFERRDYEEARERFEAALPLHKQVANVAGAANCISSLGDVAFERGDYEEARQRFEAALPLCKQASDVLGEAFCIESLGDIALERSDHEEARGLYEAALPLHQQAGSVLGEANCTQGFGDVEEAKGNFSAACARWLKALALYASIPEPKSIGLAHIRLARGAATPGEVAEHREAARAAWESIDRPDLIDKYLDTSA